MEITPLRRFLMRSRLTQFWCFLRLNRRILRGVAHVKRIPPFTIRYKVSYILVDQQHPSAIANTHKPPQVGYAVQLAHAPVEILSIRQVMRPRGSFCFLEARCRVVHDHPSVRTISCAP